MFVLSLLYFGLFSVITIAQKIHTAHLCSYVFFLIPSFFLSLVQWIIILILGKREKKNIFARTFFIDFLKHVSRISAQNTLRIFTYSKNTTHYIPHGTAVLKLKASQNLHSLEVVLFPWSKWHRKWLLLLYNILYMCHRVSLLEGPSAVHSRLCGWSYLVKFLIRNLS